MGDAEEIIGALGLKPHPEGGWYSENFRDELAKGRAHSTAIYFLLRAGERSHWHRIDAAEVWHYYAGAPLILSLIEGQVVSDMRLGPDIVAGERPQFVIPPGAWQAARSSGAWTLVGCTVAPGFDFDKFELAPPNFDPAKTR